VEPTYHQRIMTAHEDYLPLEALNALITELEKACDNNDCERIRNLLLGAPAGYQSGEQFGGFCLDQTAKSNSLTFITI